MKYAELQEGGHYWVDLPYDAGRGVARIVNVNAAAPERHPSRHVLVEFRPGYTAFGQHLVAPARIVRPHRVAA